jgi:hypothetical protein
VKLVKDSWNLSFTRVNTNKKAVLHRGWGPRTLNKNVLLLPEILAMKPSSTEEETMKSNDLSSSLLPSDLNISQGLAGTLVECISSKTIEKPTCEVATSSTSGRNAMTRKEEHGEP